MVVGRWSLANPAGEPPTTTDQRPEITEHIASACVTFWRDARWYTDWQASGIPSRFRSPDTGDCYVLPQQVISGYDLQRCSGSYLPGIPLSTHSCSFRSPGAGRLYGRVAGRGIGCPGSGDYGRRHRCDPGGDGSPLPLRHGFGGRSESTRLNSSHSQISYAVFCLKKKKKKKGNENNKKKKQTNKTRKK